MTIHALALRLHRRLAKVDGSHPSVAKLLAAAKEESPAIVARCRNAADNVLRLATPKQRLAIGELLHRIEGGIPPSDVGRFARKLTALREAAALSIPQLAAAAGLPRQTIHRLERGECQPALSTAVTLARALGQSVSVFE